MQSSHATPVLIVEDDARLQSILVRGLQRYEFPTYAAGSLAGAYEVLGSTLVAAIVIDLDLPDGSGWELVRWARAAGNRQFRTIVITAGATPRWAPPEPDLRPDAFLRKPFAIGELASCLMDIKPAAATAGPVAGEGHTS